MQVDTPLLSTKQHSEAQAAFDRGLEWLLKQQADDGGWHSATYGALRDGAALTALAVYTFHLVARSAPGIEAAVERAGAFLSHGFAKRRTIASPDGSLDYPTYAAAMVLTAQQDFPQLAQQLKRDPLLDYVLGSQVTERRGFTPESPEFGGWDFLGPDDATGISTGTNVSVTFYALEALQAFDAAEAKAARELARGWLARAQGSTGDGGFPFTADASSLNNKALWHDRQRAQPRSYGTATADGVQALLAAGVPPSDDSVERAIKWLVDHPKVEIVPGFEELPVELGWRDGLRYYYAQSLSRVVPRLSRAVARDRAEKLAGWLGKEQEQGGSWKNDSARMREDDPLIATSFALTALGTLLVGA